LPLPESLAHAICMLMFVTFPLLGADALAAGDAELVGAADDPLFVFVLLHAAMIPIRPTMDISPNFLIIC
jgi:hypothetical protein